VSVSKSERAAKQFRLLAKQIDEPESAARLITLAEKIERSVAAFTRIDTSA